MRFREDVNLQDTLTAAAVWCWVGFVLLAALIGFTASNAAAAAFGQASAYFLIAVVLGYVSLKRLGIGLARLVPAALGLFGLAALGVVVLLRSI